MSPKTKFDHLAAARLWQFSKRRGARGSSSVPLGSVVPGCTGQAAPLQARGGGCGAPVAAGNRLAACPLPPEWPGVGPRRKRQPLGQGTASPRSSSAVGAGGGQGGARGARGKGAS